jgi:hypothetical protein
VSEEDMKIKPYSTKAVPLKVVINIQSNCDVSICHEVKLMEMLASGKRMKYDKKILSIQGIYSRKYDIYLFPWHMSDLHQLDYIIRF